MPSTLDVSVTVSSSIPVPVNSGVVSLVTLSVFTPVSEAASRSGVDGAAAVVVSTVTDNIADAPESLPAASAWLAVIS